MEILFMVCEVFTNQLYAFHIANILDIRILAQNLVLVLDVVFS